MKNVGAAASILVAGSALEGCRAVKGIFDAGLWAGVILVVVLFAIVGGAFSLLRGR
jgi:hypothetical protein